MKRALYSKLIEWKNTKGRRPLVIYGARQVGKTWLLKEFGDKEYDKVAFVSLDRNEAAAQLIRTERQAERLLRGLSALLAVDITPGDTLIILDEIQDCPEALERLKIFCEDAPDYHIAVAGSLLGISLHEGFSFPVGKVDELTLHPMSFNEFLTALGKEKMNDIIERQEWNLIAALSGEYIDLLRQYYYVSGMPAAVKSYIEGNGLQEVRQQQKRIIADYEKDFSKQAPSRQVPRIRMVWQNLLSQLAKENKKFIYGALRKGARANDFEEAIQWLIDAGIVYKVRRTKTVAMPLKFYEDMNAFKLFILDVGLMGAMADVPAGMVLVGDNIFKEYKGAFTETFVCSQLATTGIPVYYHSVEKSRIELDFVVQLYDNVYPLEVKAEENVRAKSMKTFIDLHPELKGLRLSMKDHIDQSWLENIPLYAFLPCLKARYEHGTPEQI